MAEYINKITQIVDMKGDEEIARLEGELLAAEENAENLKSEIKSLGSTIRELQSVIDSMNAASGFDEIEGRFYRLRRATIDFVKAWKDTIQGVMLNREFGDNNPRMENALHSIERGMIDATEAYAQAKAEFNNSDNKLISGDTFDTSRLDNFNSALNRFGETLDVVLTKITRMEEEGTKTLGGVTGSTSSGFSDALQSIVQSTQSAVEGLGQIGTVLEDINKKALGFNFSLDNSAGRSQAIAEAKQQVVDYAETVQNMGEVVSSISRSDAFRAAAPRGSELQKELAAVTRIMMEFNSGKITKGVQSNFVQTSSAINKFVDQVRTSADVLVQFLNKTNEAGITNIDTSKLAAPIISDETINAASRAESALDPLLGVLQNLLQTMSQTSQASSAIGSVADQMANMASSGEAIAREPDIINEANQAASEYVKVYAQAAEAEAKKASVSGEVASAQTAEAAAINAAAQASESDAQASQADASAMEQQAKAATTAAAAVSELGEKTARTAEEQRAHDNVMGSVFSTLKNVQELYSKWTSISLDTNTEQGAGLMEQLARLIAQLEELKAVGESFDAGVLQNKLAGITSAFKKIQQEGATPAKEAEYYQKQAEARAKAEERAAEQIIAAQQKASEKRQKELEREEKAAEKAYQKELDAFKKAEDEKAAYEQQRQLERESRTLKGKVSSFLTEGEDRLKSRMEMTIGYVAIVMKAVRMIKKMVSTTIELNSAMTELQIVTRGSDKDMADYSKTVTQMAKDTAQSTKDLIDATTVYARLGYSMEESATLSKYTAMLQSVGGIDASSAQDAMTAIVKAYGKGVDDVEDIMNKLVTVGNNFPISVKQIAEGMNNAGSMLAVAGNSMEQSIALLTAANTTIQDISKASTGLRTIAARIRKTTTELDELGETINEAKYEEMLSALTKHGVSLTENGEYRETYAILKDVAAVWEQLSSMEQAAVSEALAGTRQQNVLLSIISQFQEAEGAMNAMAESAGALDSAYDTYLSSIQAHINQLKAAFDELSLAAINSDFVKSFVDAAKIFVESLTSVIDKIGALGTLLGGGILYSILKGGIIPQVIQSLYAFADAGALTGTVALNIGKLAFAASGVVGPLLAVAAAIGAIVSIVKIYKKLNPSLDNLKDSANKSKQELDEMREKVETATKRIEELNNLKTSGEITAAQENELAQLQEQVALYEKELELLQFINEAKQAEVVKKTNSDVDKWFAGGHGSGKTALDEAINDYKTYEDVISSYSSQADEAIENGNVRLATTLQKRIGEVETKQRALLDTIKDGYNELNGYADSLKGATDPTSIANLERLSVELQSLFKFVGTESTSFEEELAKLPESIKDKLAKGVEGIKELTSDEIKELNKWFDKVGVSAEALARHFLNLGGKQKLFDEATRKQIGDLASFRNELAATKQALDDYNNALSGGEKGDAFEEYRKIYQGMLEDIEAGKIDSNRMQAGANLLFSDEQLSAWNYDMQKVAETLQSTLFTTLFDPEDKSGTDAGKRFLETVLGDPAKYSKGIEAIRNADGSIDYLIKDHKELAKAFGMSTEAMDALLDLIDLYDVGTMRDAKDNAKLIEQYRELDEAYRDVGQAAGTSKKGVKAFIEALAQEGYSNFDIFSIISDLQEAGAISKDMDGVGDMIAEVMGNISELDAEEAEPTVGMDNSAFMAGYDQVKAYMEAISAMRASPTVTLTTATGDKGASAGGSLPGGAGRASGTIVALGSGNRNTLGQGGDTLVNELGPELISDRGSAFIANGGKPGFTYLSKDAIVFNAKETEELLRSGKLRSHINAFAEGSGRASIRNRLIQGKRTPARAQAVDDKGKTVATVARDKCRHCYGMFSIPYFQKFGYCNICGWHPYGIYPVASWAIEAERKKNEEAAARSKAKKNEIAKGLSAENQRKEQLAIRYPNRYEQDEKGNWRKRSNVGTGTPEGLGGGGGGGGASQSDPQKFDWVGIKLDRLRRKVEKFTKVATSGFYDLSTRLSNSKDEIKAITDEMNVALKNSSNAAARYKKEADSIKLDSGIKKLVREGAIDIKKYNEKTAKLINEYQEWYEKYLDEAQKEEEYRQAIMQAYQERFEMVQTDYENQIEQIEHSTEMASKELERISLQGYLTNVNAYDESISLQQEKIATLKKELKDLNKYMKEALDNGKIQEGSEAWYDMKSAINDVEEAIADADIELIQLQKDARDAAWNAFDWAQDRISQLTQEANFLIELMSSKDLFNDNGQMTSAGLATAEMRAINYDTYMMQADEYAKEMKRISEDLAKDKYNTELIERREELLGLQQQSILSAEQEKEAVRSLVEQGIQIQLQSMQDLIQSYVDSLDSAKDLYEYQKKIRDQAKDVADIEKQISAYQNDTSEENRARLQKLQEQLKAARETLAGSERDQAISDQKKLLDELYAEYEDILNARLDDVDALMREMIDTVNANEKDILAELRSITNNVGYTMTGDMSNAVIKSESYYDGVFNGVNSIHIFVQGIYDIVNDMAGTGFKINVQLPHYRPDNSGSGGPGTGQSGRITPGYSRSGYATGGLNTHAGIAMLHGTANKPELVLNPEDTKNMLDIVSILRSKPAFSALYNNTGYGSGVNIGALSVTIPIDHVQDYNEMVSQMQKDPKFEKLVNAMTLDRAVGRSSLSKNRIQF